MRAIVVGGGVAGAVSAVALRRLGIDVMVIEAYDEPGGDVGSFVSLATNGLRGLAAIDCLERVRRRAVPVGRQRMWSASGKLLGDVARGRRADDPLRSVTLMRAHLVGELRDAAGAAGAEIITGERLVGAEPVPGGVRASFASGRSEHADLLVGADGLWSTTRRILDPQAPQPEYAGLYTVSGVARDVGVDLDEGVFNMVLAQGGAFIHLREPGGGMWWAAQVNSPVPPKRDGVTDADWLDQVREIYRSERLPSQIIAATTRLHRPALHHVLDPVPIWHNDHLVLVGDAAHPVGAGQGASMAIEDGLVLAAALRDATSTAGALAEYERRRRPRRAKLNKSAEDNRKMKKSGPVRRGMEQLVMPVVFRHFYEKATGWLYAYDPQEEFSTPPQVSGARR